MHNDQRHIIVTGGAGFIGSCVLRQLMDKQEQRLVVVDEFDCTDKWKNLVGKNICEILHKEELFSWLEGRHEEIKGIVHLGACSSTVEADSKYLLNNNYRYTVQLAEYALKHDIRMVYASSAATYGDGSLGFNDDHDGLSDLRPLNMYGYSKHLFDLWAKRQGVLDKLVGLKYFNVFGPNEYHKGRMASAIFHIVPQAQQDGEIRLFKSTEPSHCADGEQCRDFIYVKDAARMTCAFLNHSAAGIFNIGRGVPATWNQVSASVFKALDLVKQVIYIDMPKDLIGKYQSYTCANMDKTKKALGRDAECQELEASIIEYIQQYLIRQRIW